MLLPVPFLLPLVVLLLMLQPAKTLLLLLAPLLLKLPLLLNLALAALLFELLLDGLAHSLLGEPYVMTHAAKILRFETRPFVLLRHK